MESSPCKSFLLAVSWPVTVLTYLQPHHHVRPALSRFLEHRPSQGANSRASFQIRERIRPRNKGHWRDHLRPGLLFSAVQLLDCDTHDPSTGTSPPVPPHCIFLLCPLSRYALRGTPPGELEDARHLPIGHLEMHLFDNGIP